MTDIEVLKIEILDDRTGIGRMIEAYDTWTLFDLFKVYADKMGHPISSLYFAFAVNIGEEKSIFPLLSEKEMSDLTLYDFPLPFICIHERGREKREIIIDSMNNIPDDIDIHDGCILLDLLFIVRHHLRLDGRRQQGQRYNEEIYRACSLARFFKFFVKSYETDSDRRITKLDLGTHFVESDPMDESDICPHFYLPPIIERLTKLKCLTLFNCGGLPIELNNLLFLEEINVLDRETETRSLFEDLRDELVLSNLKCIRLIAWDGFLIPQTYQFVTNRLSCLETLQLRWGDIDDSNEVLRVLQYENLSFIDTLKSIQLQQLDINEECLATLLLEIRPRYPKLDDICIRNNNITSLTSFENKIIKRLKEQRASPASSQSRMDLSCTNLRRLNLLWNPVMKKINNDDDPNEKAALLTILNVFNDISRISSYDDIESEYNYEKTQYDEMPSKYSSIRHEYNSDVEYLLRINHAGRKCIMGNVGSGAVVARDEMPPSPTTTPTPTETMNIAQDHSNNTIATITPVVGVKHEVHNDQNRYHIKPALWPLILERSYKKSDEIDGLQKCATGMFYLINHEGSPILQHIISMHQNEQLEQSSGTTRGEPKKKQPRH